MGGAAAVLGAARALAEMRPPVEGHVVLAACENFISDTARWPGNIITASSGVTNEVGNTDAETRLTAADSLAYAPGLPAGTHVFELSTFMGAVIVALDQSIGGLMAPYDDLATSLVSAAAAAGERLWCLPLDGTYVSSLDSTLAGVNSIGAKGGVGAGTITAGLFFAKFVRAGALWAHIDIAGAARNHGGGGGGTGYGVATLVRSVHAFGRVGRGRGDSALTRRSAGTVGRRSEAVVEFFGRHFEWCFWQSLTLNRVSCVFLCDMRHCHENVPRIKILRTLM
ncbi:hypothetical protein BU14_0453s0014 [Porphyra umbilicalis]|nr:hypothetical protein BU14_0453s0014 [Porphyra umbilicalis]|eukprot:OSX72250.1 hypothetical protein BU14_0453s0014 [Porphyra umbilicalis]